MIKMRLCFAAFIFFCVMSAIDVISQPLLAKYDFSIFLFPDGRVLLEAQNPADAPLPTKIELDCSSFDKSTKEKTFKEYKTTDHLNAFNGRSFFRAIIGQSKNENQVSCIIRLGEATFKVESNRKYPETKFTPESRDKLGEKRVQISEISESSPVGKLYNWNENELVVDEGCVAKNQRTNQNAFLMESWRQFNLENIGTKNVYLAITTSPSRLRYLHYVLQNLDMQLVSNILITLPLKYKNKQKYSIPRKLKAKYPNIIYVSTSIDFGPIGKIVGAVEYVKSVRKSLADDDIFISIDDDNAYAKNLVDTYVYFSLKNPAIVGAASGLSYDFFSIPHVGMPAAENVSVSGEISATYRPIIEGFAGIVYRGSAIDTELMGKLVRRDLDPSLGSCYLSDDLIISYLLDYNNKSKMYFFRRISNGMFSTAFRADFHYAKDENAIHLKNTDESRARHNANFARYRQCYQQLLNIFCDFSKPQVSFKTRQDVLKHFNFLN